MRIVSWIKNNKLSALLLIILLIFLYKNWSGNLKISRNYNYQDGYGYTTQTAEGGITKSMLGAPEGLRSGIIPPPINEVPPAPEVKDRLVIRESNLSILVNNVRDSVNNIIDYAVRTGGYMVQSSLQNPEEAASATVVIRVPAKSLTQSLEYLRSLGIRVISENLTGYDVTDQYVDIEARLATLNKTKAKFEDILDKAVQVQDILNVEREIINLQSQIDALKGQQQYLSKSAEMAKITVYLSTDELALPYAPTEAWRPQVIFKLAVRSLVGSLRSLASSAIWIAVYAVIWVPALIIVVILYKKFGKKQK